jgi:hypothetical protein
MEEVSASCTLVGNVLSHTTVDLFVLVFLVWLFGQTWNSIDEACANVTCPVLKARCDWIEEHQESFTGYLAVKIRPMTDGQLQNAVLPVRRSTPQRTNWVDPFFSSAGYFYCYGNGTCQHPTFKPDLNVLSLENDDALLSQMTVAMPFIDSALHEARKKGEFSKLPATSEIARPVHSRPMLGEGGEERNDVDENESDEESSQVTRGGEHRCRRCLRKGVKWVMKRAGKSVGDAQNTYSPFLRCAVVLISFVLFVSHCVLTIQGFEACLQEHGLPEIQEVLRMGQRPQGVRSSQLHVRTGSVLARIQLQHYSHLSHLGFLLWIPFSSHFFQGMLYAKIQPYKAAGGYCAGRGACGHDGSDEQSQPQNVPQPVPQPQQQQLYPNPPALEVATPSRVEELVSRVPVSVPAWAKQAGKWVDQRVKPDSDKHARKDARKAFHHPNKKQH